MNMKTLLKGAAYAALVACSLGTAYLVSGCNGSSGNRDVLVRIDWVEDDDLDLEVARDNNDFGNPDNIWYDNLDGGPPAWGELNGDDTGGSNNSEEVTFTTRGDEEPYNAFVNGYDVSPGPILVRCRVFFDGSNNPRTDDTFFIDQDDVIHFAIIRHNGVNVPPGDIKVKVEKKRPKKSLPAPQAPKTVP
jgi:hypothetical protein